MFHLTTRRSILAIVALSALGLATANDARQRPVVKIGVVKSLVRNVSPQLFQVLAGTFGTVMQAQTGLNGELLAHDSAEEIRNKLAAGELQLGVMYGVEFGWMKQKQPDLVPLMVNEIDPEALEAVLVVRNDFAIKNVNDCRGKKLAIPNGTRADTKLFLSQRCRLCGFSIEEMFGDTANPTSIEEALDQVVDGVAEVAVVERSGYKMFERRKPGRHRQLTVLEQSEKFPPSVIVYLKNKIDDATLAKFRDGMSTAHKSTLGAHMMSLMSIRQFGSVHKDYHGRVDEILKKYPGPVGIPPATNIEVIGN